MMRLPDSDTSIMKCHPRRNLTEMLHVLGDQTGTKLSCIKPTSKVRGLSIEPCSSRVCIDKCMYIYIVN